MATVQPTLPAALRPAELDVRHTLGLDKRGARRRWIKRGLWIALAAALLALIGARVRRAFTPVERHYDTAPAAMRDVDVSVTASGTLEPWTSVDVGPEISGRVRAIHADYNDHVTRGQVLVELDTEQLRAQVEQAESQVALGTANLAQARATRVEARTTLDRIRSLVGQGFVADAELDAAEAAARRADAAEAAAAAQERAARASLEVARTNLDRATIRSPIDGMVLSRSVDVGQTVIAALQAPVLFRLAEDLRRMRLIVDIDEADVGRVRDGQQATFTVAAWPGRLFQARVASVRNAAQVRENVVTYEAVLDVDNGEGLLRPGMTGTSQIVAESEKGVLTVPNAALRYRPAGSSGEPGSAPRVWVLDQGKPSRVAIDTGASDGAYTVVHGALAPGTEVVVGESKASR